MIPNYNYERKMTIQNQGPGCCVSAKGLQHRIYARSVSLCTFMLIEVRSLCFLVQVYSLGQLSSEGEAWTVMVAMC
jgi:hypothetical protein